MIFLIDTCCNFLNFVLYEDNKIIVSYSEKFNNNLSQHAVLNINKYIKKYLKNIKKIIVANGPGSYTGIRIGLTIAKTLAYCLKIDIYSISKLRIMELNNPEKAIKAVIIDARRNNCFASIYDENHNILLNEQFISYDTLNEYCKKLNCKININDCSIGNVNTVIENIDKYIIKENCFLLDAKYLKKHEAEE